LFTKGHILNFCCESFYKSEQVDRQACVTYNAISLSLFNIAFQLHSLYSIKRDEFASLSILLTELSQLHSLYSSKQKHGYNSFLSLFNKAFSTAQIM
jgi:hypothetical protein